MEDGPWEEWRAGQPISLAEIAGFLRKFRIKPRQVWKGNPRRNKKGYRLNDLEDASEVLSRRPSSILGFLQGFCLGKEAEMSVFKRGGVYYYEFSYRGQRYRGSTRLTNKTAALRVEALRRSDLLRGRACIESPRFESFVENEFLPSARDPAVRGFFFLRKRLCIWRIARKSSGISRSSCSTRECDPPRSTPSGKKMFIPSSFSFRRARPDSQDGAFL